MKSFILALILLIVGATAFAEPVKMRTVILTNLNTAFTSEHINIDTIEKDISHILFKRATLPLTEPLYVVIASNGGETDHMYSMARILTKLPNVQLLCKYCASAAGGLFQLTSLKRVVIKRSQMLMHEMRYREITAASATDEVIDHLKVESDRFNRIFYTKLKISKKDYEEKILNKDWIVYGEEIVKLGLADEMIKVSCSPYMKQILTETCKE